MPRATAIRRGSGCGRWRDRRRVTVRLQFRAQPNDHSDVLLTVLHRRRFQPDTVRAWVGYPAADGVTVVFLPPDEPTLSRRPVLTARFQDRDEDPLSRRTTAQNARTCRSSAPRHRRWEFDGSTLTSIAAARASTSFMRKMPTRDRGRHQGGRFPGERAVERGARLAGGTGMAMDDRTLLLQS